MHKSTEILFVEVNDGEKFKVINIISNWRIEKLFNEDKLETIRTKPHFEKVRLLDGKSEPIDIVGLWDAEIYHLIQEGGYGTPHIGEFDITYKEFIEQEKQTEGDYHSIVSEFSYIDKYLNAFIDNGDTEEEARFKLQIIALHDISSELDNLKDYLWNLT